MSQPMVEFEDWERVLRATVPAGLQAGYREAVQKFRYWLREKGKAPTVEAFKEHLDWKKSYLAPEKYEVRRQALRWYWEKGRKRSGGEGEGNENCMIAGLHDCGIGRAGEEKARRIRRPRPTEGG